MRGAVGKDSPRFSEVRMKIGMLIAIEREIAAFLESGSDIREEKIGCQTVYHASMGRHEVYAVRSGYGEIDAAAGAQLLITGCGCEVIMNFGVVGALDPALRVDDLFVVSRVCHYDYDVSPIDPVRKHQYEDYADEFIPLDAELVRKVREVLPEIREVAAASGDQFIEDRGRKAELRALGCEICDMEVAAIARVSARNGVKCLSIKCISDTFDGDGGDFQTNVTRSAAKAFRALQALIGRI